MDRSAFEESQARRKAGMGRIYNYALGFLWTGLGVFFLLHERLGMAGAFDPGLTVLFGGLCVFYGLFRIWRAYRSGSNT